MQLDYQTYANIPAFLDSLEKKIPNIDSPWVIADLIDGIFYKIVEHNNNEYPLDIAWYMKYGGSVNSHGSIEWINLKILIQGYQISTKFNKFDLNDWQQPNEFKNSDFYHKLLDFHNALGEYNYDKTYSIPTKAVLALVYENLSNNGQFPSEELTLAVNILNNITT